MLLSLLLVASWFVVEVRVSFASFAYSYHFSSEYPLRISCGLMSMSTVGLTRRARTSFARSVSNSFNDYWEGDYESLGDVRLTGMRTRSLRIGVMAVAKRFIYCSKVMQSLKISKMRLTAWIFSSISSDAAKAAMRLECYARLDAARDSLMSGFDLSCFRTSLYAALSSPYARRKSTEEWMIETRRWQTRIPVKCWRRFASMLTRFMSTRTLSMHAMSTTRASKRSAQM